MAKSPPDTVMVIAELHEYLEISRATLYKLAQERKPGGQKVGRHWRFHKAAIGQRLGRKRASG